jgi:hypothetical protein
MQKQALAVTRGEVRQLRNQLKAAQARKSPLRKAAGKVFRRLPESVRSVVRPARRS